MNTPQRGYLTPIGVETQWDATGCRTSAGKSLHGKDLRPDGQHPDEQRERRQRGGFFSDGPNHELILPDRTERERCSIFVPKSRAVGRWQGSELGLTAVFDLPEV
jgi:hypothetical protein